MLVTKGFNMAVNLIKQLKLNALRMVEDDYLVLYDMPKPKHSVLGVL